MSRGKSEKVSEVSAALDRQLEKMGAANPLFRDLRNKYMKMHRLADKQWSDIVKVGVKSEDGKENPSVRGYCNTCNQMVSMLQKLGIKADK